MEDTSGLFVFLKSLSYLMGRAVALSIETIKAEVIEARIAVTSQDFLGDQLSHDRGESHARVHHRNIQAFQRSVSENRQAIFRVRADAESVVAILDLFAAFERLLDFGDDLSRCLFGVDAGIAACETLAGKDAAIAGLAHVEVGAVEEGVKVLLVDWEGVGEKTCAAFDGEFDILCC